MIIINDIRYLTPFNSGAILPLAWGLRSLSNKAADKIHRNHQTVLGGSNMKRKLFALFLVVIVLLPLLLPGESAFASDLVKVKIKNKSGSQFVLYLSGPENYEIKVKGNTSKAEVVPGTYRYRYTACGNTQTTGTLAATKDVTFLIPKCPTGSGGTVSFQLRNQTGEYMRLVMTGKVSYNLYLAPGNTQLTLQEGKYKYTATGCGGATLNGKINIRKGFKWWKWTCD
jgi:hypothetical protein